MLNIAARRADFHALHKESYFLLATAWDVGTAKRLEAMGFAGLASSNSSLAWVLGRGDGCVTRDEVLTHLRLLVNATEMAVDADFGSGFALDAKDLMANVRLAIDIGIAAVSIKDGIGSEPYDLEQAVARIEWSRKAINLSGEDVLLVAHSEAILSNRTSVDETIERLVAYANAGADVLCASGLSEQAAIRGLVEAVAPKPVDIRLAKSGIRAVELGELGVRRISVGDSFAQGLWANFERIAQQFIDFGDLSPDDFPSGGSIL